MKDKLKLWIGFVSLACSILCGVLAVLGHVRLIYISYKGQDMLFNLGLLLVLMGSALFIPVYIKIRHPEKYKSDLIERNDERNVSIRHKAGYKAGQIVLYVNFVFMFVYGFHLIDSGWIALSPSFSVVLYLSLRGIFYSVYVGK